MKRRAFLGHAAQGLALASLSTTDLVSTVARAAPSPPPLLVTAHGLAADALVRRSVEGLGGIGRFVKRGDKVVVKPNIGWDRTPEQAANTNPEVVASIIRLCKEAGAASVLVMDNTCNDPRRCYLRSGISEAAKAAGATVQFFDEDRVKKMTLAGERLKEWEVHPAFIEADVRINVPIAKHHGLADVTLGMKNWMGAVGGRRERMHQAMGESIVDLAAFFKPQLTIIDGIRILTRGGPQGGSPDDVQRLDTLIASADPVAAEARGAALHGRTLDATPHILLAEKRGLGRARWEPGEELRIEV